MIWIILILGLVLRSIGLNQSLWLDEAINVLATQNFSLWGIITEYAKADFHPPLFFIILWIWTRIFGVGEVFVRIPSVVFGSLTIYLIYLLGRKLHSKTLGLISALLLAINPLHIYYSQEARMYALATLAVAFNFLLFIKLVKKERVNVLIFIISNLWVLSSDYVAYLIFPAQFVFLLLNRQREIFLFWLKWFGISIIPGILWLPVFLSQLNTGSVASVNLPTWKFVVGGFDIKTTALTLVKFIIGKISLSNKTIYYLILLPICSIFLYFILKGVRLVKNPIRNLLLTWILIPIILAILISFVIPIYSYFRLLFILPAFIILLSLGIISHKSKLRYIFLGIVLIIQLFSSSVYLLNNSYQREDWRGLVNFFKNQNNAFVILFESSGILPSFDYYAKGELLAKGALKDFPAKSENDVAIPDDLVNNYKEVYLVDYLVQISDPDRLVKKKLVESGYKILETKDFNGVGFVYHYVKNN